MNIEKLKRGLVSQKNSKFKGNIYHYSQVNFAYNSNKIEGSHLSEDETEEIFVTNSYIPKSDDVVKLDDLIISAEISKIKPNLDFYKYILNKYKIEANELLFLDDNIKNINGARKIGIQTIMVEKSINMIDEIKLLLMR